MDNRKVDLLLTYALAVAGLEDPGERELGPIHLIKYVYLGDLAYADRHEGQTFTNAPWRFHHFGPWAPEVQGRIPLVVQASGAKERTYASTRQAEDAVRYLLSDEGVAQELETQLPSEITRTIKRAVHLHHGDTSGLLHEVYLTAPMLRAAPGEPLDFTPAQKPEVPPPSTDRENPERPLSVRAQRKRDDAVQAFRARVAQRATDPTTRRLVAPVRPVVYDEDFFAVQRLLDSEAGGAIEPTSGELVFSASVWKDPARGKPDA